MPIRVDEPRTSRPTTSTPARSRSRLVGAVAVGVVVAVLLGVLVGRCSAGSEDPVASAQPPAPSGSQPPVVEPSQPSTLPEAPGVVAGSGEIGRVYEMQTGFTQTTEGAVQAAMNYAIVDASPAYYNQAHYDAIQAEMYTTPEVRKQIGYRQQTVNALRKYYQVNSSGQPLTDGKPDSRKKIWDAAYLQYGAFKVVIDEPEKVRVQLWYPIVQGVDYRDAKTTANIRLHWVLTEETVEWVRGDWLQAGHAMESDPPLPANRGQVVTSFAERAELLGTDGWMLPDNAAEVDTPELQLPGR